MSCHRQVLVTVEGTGAFVDEGLADLIRATWELGIGTMSCCQDAGESLAYLPGRAPHMAAYVEASQGRAYVDFVPLDGLVDFLNAVQGTRPESGLAERILHWMAVGAWQKELIVLPRPSDGLYAVVGAQLSFPVSDVAEIVRCLVRAKLRP